MTARPNAASVALLDGERVLLIQRARPPYAGRWTLPGGRLEPGEDATEGASREIYEELGLTCRDLRPVTKLEFAAPRPFVLQVFATQSFAGTIAASDEIAGYRWVSAAKLGELPLTPDLPSVLVRAFGLFG
jgi:8-oxo-dGTP pyrophosphatase MutT (NUDIX family)